MSETTKHHLAREVKFIMLILGYGVSYQLDLVEYLALILAKGRKFGKRRLHGGYLVLIMKCNLHETFNHIRHTQKIYPVPSTEVAVYIDKHIRTYQMDIESQRVNRHTAEYFRSESIG